MKLHPLPASVNALELPLRFTYPFCYEPHPLCVAAADEVRSYLRSQPQWSEELSKGKMLGVMIVEKNGERGFLAAFSGTLEGRTQHGYFVPPVFDLMAPDSYFLREESAISSINRTVEKLKASMVEAVMPEEGTMAIEAAKVKMKEAKRRRDALRQSMSPEERGAHEEEWQRESQFLKAELRRTMAFWKAKKDDIERKNEPIHREIEALQAERQSRSQALQEWLFAQYTFLNARGESKCLTDIFTPATPPSGAGDCCAPKLLQYAYLNGMKPRCMAEFWVGASPHDELRTDGHYYPACRSKCLPILGHMLRGLEVDENPLVRGYEALVARLRIIYEGHEMVVVSKPAGMLSVPGKEELPSVFSSMKSRFPEATGPMIVHRLDMDTSGLMVVALTERRYHELQDLFVRHRVEKTYLAVLERSMRVGEVGEIRLPIRPDVTDRPRQMVDEEHGRTAVTRYEVIGDRDGHALVRLQPLTGRTHQLRVHCAHPRGLNNPIVGDRLYGKAGDRLMLHAARLRFEDWDFTDEDFLLPVK